MVLIIPDWGRVKAVVGDVGAWVPTVEVSAAAVVAADIVVLPVVVLEVLAVLVAEVGTVGVGVMMVVPCVGGGEVLVVAVLLVVVMMVVPCVGGAVVLGTTVVPAVVVISDWGRVVAVAGDVGAWVPAVEVSTGETLVEEPAVGPGVADVVWQCSRSQHSTLTS